MIRLDSDILHLMPFMNEGFIFPTAWRVVDKEPFRISLAANSHHSPMILSLLRAAFTYHWFMYGVKRAMLLNPSQAPLMIHASSRTPCKFEWGLSWDCITLCFSVSPVLRAAFPFYRFLFFKNDFVLEYSRFKMLLVSPV